MIGGGFASSAELLCGDGVMDVGNDSSAWGSCSSIGLLVVCFYVSSVSAHDING